MKDHWGSWIREVCAQPHDAARVDVRCLLDISTVARDVLFVFLWILILIYTYSALRKTSSRRPVDSRRISNSIRSRYSLHDLRWLLAISLFIVHVTDIGEVLLVWKHNPWQIRALSFGFPACNALAVVFACFYYDRLEVNHKFEHTYKHQHQCLQIYLVSSLNEGNIN